MGTPVKVEATVRDLELTVSSNYDFGDTLEEAVEKFGAEVVYSKFKSSATIDLQGVMRRAACVKFKNEAGEEMIQEPEGGAQVAVDAAVAAWVPGVSTRIVLSPKEKAKQALKRLSAEELAELMASLESAEEEAGE